ncbi:MarP family serine protease [Planosporangium flavigriseum]|uniref:Serine protease n=1 Tax=Planosporangium flavigriseum TaxID=373681 RepID=A0A8J3PMC7_9ACTN|nr:MarP family serine protease [Planosporangium flavigriseum]GIG73743.1 serine protease [Planosporangium flavigriseum]
MSGTVVDLILVGLMLVFALNGYRQGFLIGLLSFIGFFGGALIGLQLGPMIARRFADDPIRVLVSLAAVFGVAAIGQAVAGFVGAKLREAISNPSARRLDDLGGALVSVVAVLLVVWLVALPLGSSSLPSLARAVKNSAILGTVDRVMPAQARALSDALRQTVDTRGFPDVFGGLTPTRVRPVPAPDPTLANSPLVLSARSSVVKVLGTAPSCSRRIEGSGFIYAPERVMTNAHVVAGTRSNTVEVNGARRSAQVVAYDPQRDLAVLYVPGLRGPVMKFSRPAETGSDAIVLGFPLDGPYDAQGARVRDRREISGPDIYNTGKVTREVYTIYGLVRSGNSGGPLVGTDGSVLGVIFAAAADDPQTGFAVTAEEASPVAAAGQTRTQATSTGNCAE